MMGRMIDTESLKELFPDDGEGSWTYNATAKAYIDAQPTIQPDVIRCKDCKHYSKYKKDYMCGLNVLAYVCETDFCSRAERREDGQTDFTASCD